FSPLHPAYLRIIFFIYCSGDHRYLHSFPTRRSSDLDFLEQHARICIWSHLCRSANCRLRSRQILRRICCAKCKPLQGFLFGNKTDRKSTRLNSSHVKISYAVFCLKKKKKQYINKISP